MRMRFLLVCLLVIFTALGITSFAHAQMMGYYSSPNPSITLSAQDQEEITEGQKLYQQIQSNQTTCHTLTNSDFDRIGEYIMEQQIGDPTKHAQMNQTMKNMMGEQGETNMHISLGRLASGCISNNSTKGGVFSMMGWGSYGYANMMYGNLGWGFEVLHAAIALIVVVDLILAGIWLWQQIRTHRKK